MEPPKSTPKSTRKMPCSTESYRNAPYGKMYRPRRRGCPGRREGTRSNVLAAQEARDLQARLAEVDQARLAEVDQGRLAEEEMMKEFLASIRDVGGFPPPPLSHEQLLMSHADFNMLFDDLQRALNESA